MRYQNDPEPKPERHSNKMMEAVEIDANKAVILNDAAESEWRIIAFVVGQLDNRHQAVPINAMSAMFRRLLVLY